MEQKLFAISILSILITSTWCSLVPQNSTQENISNPASEYCESNWWALEIVPDEWWSRWKCNFDDGSFCEERAYLHWECSPGRWEWNTIEIDEIQDNEKISDQDKEEITELIEEFWETSNEQPENSEVTCTADTKMCEDWTYVSRKWPNCEFEPCQWTTLNEEIIQETLKKYESTWSEMTENDIDLMNEIIDIFSQ